MTDRRMLYLRLALLLIVFWGMWTVRLGAKFYGEQDSSRSWIPSAVRNLDVYGYDEIGLMIVRNGYEAKEEDRELYSHHPPLLVWLPWLLTKVAGDNEVTNRIVFAFAMMISAAAFYTLVRRMYNEQMAFWGTVLFGITPFIAYFQPSYGHDPLGFMALLLFAAIFVKWLHKPNTWRFYGLIGCVILAVWTAWPAVVFVGVLGVAGMFMGNWLQRLGIVILGLVSVVAVLLMLGLYELWWEGATRSLMEAFVWRSSNSALGKFREEQQSLSVARWISGNVSHIVILGTIGLIVLVVIGVFFLKGKGRRNANWLTFSLFLSAILYFLMFRNATFIHPYYKAFLMPSFSIIAAAAIVYGREVEGIRFSRPVIDGLGLMCVAQSVYLLFLIVASTDEPSVTKAIDFLNTQDEVPEQVIMSYIGISAGTEHSVEYYAERSVDWNVPLDEVSLSDGEGALYIYCDDNQNYVLDYFQQDLPEYQQLDDQCTAYWLEG